ncbi:uncharacterized protein LOC123673973 [Harmonia axyridis]|uniref:uncharacterized protein LOC123673973 n=1 Tax=Harmonia axyridis TaxID=115357 RepID=UPI001E277B39|nr:uncharacterized protein LOC123673973 [Harmonia axyridis]
MKVFIVLIACLVASAYSRQIVIKYVPEDEIVPGQPSEQPKQKGILSIVATQVGDLAADAADTAGRVAKGIVDVPATLVSKTVSEAGRGAAEALRETGRAAAEAVEHVERGIDNIFGGWDK